MTADEMFSKAFPIIWLAENGSASISKIAVVNNPADPGGYTRGGVALNEHPEITRARLDAMAYVDFYGFYKTKYWLAPHCDVLPWPVALIVFDGEVNSGGEGAKALQLALGVTVDGNIGPITQKAANSYPSPVELAALVCYQRDEFYRAAANAATFEMGWVKRLFITALSTGGQ